MRMRPLVWFRSDLRLGDNPALQRASQKARRGLLAVYFLTPAQWNAHDWSDAKVEFVVHNLGVLSRELEDINVALLVERVDDFAAIPEKLLRLMKKHRCDALYFNREYEANEQRRDEQVIAGFRGAGIPVYAFADQTVIEPGQLRTGSGGFYSVYGAFRRRWLERIQRPELLEVLPRPRRQEALVGRPGVIPRRITGFRLSGKITDPWPAGERAARSRLRTFLERRVNDYRDERDLPARDGTSGLSPYLALGVLSPREVLTKAVDHGKRAGGSPGLSTWIDQLIWREFYRHVLVGFPHVSRSRPFRPESDAIPWRYEESEFRAWCEGRTGVPIVDAGMRQLNETGWMHNRLRMITAMFLAKHLLIDWRMGEQYFMRKLVDGDLANNNGGWQWCASTGTDAAPYFRVFNPWTQGRRFDPDGEFIRSHVPELRHLRARDMHDPERLQKLPRTTLDYPFPLVEHRKARERAIRTFGAVFGRRRRES
jgi:deoxyribodipyrimidine photo-lyase